MKVPNILLANSLAQAKCTTHCVHLFNVIFYAIVFAAQDSNILEWTRVRPKDTNHEFIFNFKKDQIYEGDIY